LGNCIHTERVSLRETTMRNATRESIDGSSQPSSKRLDVL
jgi:hypothetical protein